MERSNGCFYNEDRVPEGHTPQCEGKTGQPKALSKSYREFRATRSQVTFLSFPQCCLSVLQTPLELLGLPRLPAVSARVGGWLLSPAHPQLQAFSSKGLHFLPPPSPHLGRLGFLLPGGPPLCDWGRERGLWLHVVGWGVGRKKRSSVAPPSRPTLMLTKSLPPKPASQPRLT